MALGCCCGCRVTLPEVDEFANVTKVAAYPGNADTTPIAPYSRPWECYVGPGCDDADSYYCSYSCGQADGTSPVCYNQNFDGTSLSENWLATPLGIESCSGGAGDTIAGFDNNCYEATGNKVNFSHACVGGWKGVVAQAMWPGAWGLINSPGCDCDEGGQEQSKFASIRNKIYAHGTWKKTRNIGVADVCDGSNLVGGGGVLDCAQTVDWDQTATVDEFGNVTRSGDKRYSAHEDNSGYYTESHPITGCTIVSASYRNSVNRCDDCITWDGSGWQRCDLEGVMQFSVTQISKLLESTGIDCGTVVCNDSTAGVYFSGTPEEYRTFMESYVPNMTGAGGASVSSTVSLSNERFVFSLSATETLLAAEGSPGEELIEGTLNLELIIELSGSHLFSSAMEDCIALLDEWPLHDDAVYPWRTDASTWLVPYVRRDASGGAPSINWATDENCNFLQENPYSGRIIGSPLPAGYSGHFNFNHVNWSRHDNGSGCSACRTSLGASQASPLPNTATNWADNSFGSSMYGPGGHVSQRDDGTYAGNSSTGPIDGVIMQKWAETLEKWPSANFFRPFGDDRWRADMDATQCITNITGNVLDLAADITGVSAGDLVVIYGGSLNAQIWTVASVGTAQITLGTQFDPSPAGTVETLVAANMDEWANHGVWGTYGQVSKLRWQYDRDGVRYPWPRITGKDLNITVDGTDPWKITLPENQLVSGDKVIVLNGGTQVGGTLYFKRITDTTGELYTDAGFTTTQDATGANKLRGYEASPVAQSWNTDASRNTVVVRDFDSQYREADADPMVDSVNTTLTQYTLSRSSSKQCVFCASPNSQDTTFFSDNGSGSIVVTWGADKVAADMCFGEEWHTDVVQTMADPLWQSPDSNCGAGTSQDATPCEAGANKYHYPALVEPLRASNLPSGAPTIPGATWFDEDGAAPSAVGAGAGCSSTPRDRGTPHSIREAWEDCQNQKDQRNSGL